MAELSLQHDLKQTLELLLAPRLMEMLKVLQLPYLSLMEHLDKAAEENPVLEVERQDEYVEFIRYLASDPGVKKKLDTEEMPGLANIGNVDKTLEQHLLEQLELEGLDEQYQTMARRIIENIDDFGFVINYPRLREQIMKDLDVSRPTVDKALSIVQSFEPEGVGARDVKECLLLQIEQYSFANDRLQEILAKAVKNHLADLSAGNYSAVARGLKIPDSGVKEIAAFIKNNLNPNPGAAYGNTIQHVIPSYAVEKSDTGLKLVNLEQRYGPRISLSDRYLKMLDDPKTDAKTKEFLQAKLKTAKNLIEDFHKRTETLAKIVRKIVDSQDVFFEKGVTWLKPLAQKDLAQEFGLHPSTISRGVAEKYIQTPLGLFPLKFLCPRGPRGLTVLRMKTLIAEIVKREDKSQPLSDSQITKMVNDHGGHIDRRTLAYYRQELKIPTADQREK